MFQIQHSFQALDTLKGGDSSALSDDLETVGC